MIYIVLAFVIVAYGIFVYMKQKTQGRQYDRHERLREKHEAFMNSIRDKPDTEDEKEPES